VSRASLYEAKSAWDRAIADYDEILKLVPNAPDAYEARQGLPDEGRPEAR
jgi:hypothetical protein